MARRIPLDHFGVPDVSYNDLVREALGEWHGSATFGFYQGDYLYVFRDGKRVGCLIVGYGSCSGCDHLQGVVGYSTWDDMSEEERDKLRADLDAMVEGFRRSVRWFDSEPDLLAWLTNDADLQWYGNEEDFADTLQQLLWGKHLSAFPHEHGET